jgi:hypothetical protein
MKRKRMALGIAMATIMLATVFAVAVTTAVSGASAGTTSAQSALTQSSPGDIVGAGAASGPAVCSWSSGRVDFFVQDSARATWHKYLDSTGGWHDWKKLGGTATSDPCAVVRADSSMAVFARGNDGGLYADYCTSPTADTWTGYVLVPGNAQLAAGTGPAACSMSSNRFDLFAVGTDKAIYQMTWSNPSYGAWHSIGKPASVQFASSPAAVVLSGNALSVFARGTDGAVWDRQQIRQDAWIGTSWYSLSGTLAAGTGPGAATSLKNSGNLFVLGTGTDHAVYYKYSPARGTWYPSLTNWYHIGKPISGSTSSVAATHYSTQDWIMICVRGGDNAVWINGARPQMWAEGWQSIGSPP